MTFENSEDSERDCGLEVERERLDFTVKYSTCIYRQAMIFYHRIAIRCRIKVSFIDAQRFSEIAHDRSTRTAQPYGQHGQ